MEVKLTADELMMFVEEGQVDDLEMYDQIEQLTKGFQPDRLRILLTHVKRYIFFRIDELEAEYKQQILEKMYNLKQQGKPLPLIKFKVPAEDASPIAKKFYAETQKYPVVDTKALLPMDAQLKIFAIRNVEAHIRHLLKQHTNAHAKEQEKGNSRDTREDISYSQVQLALFYFYAQKAGELPWFENMCNTKGEAIAREVEKFKLSAKAFEIKYNKISKDKHERISAKQIINIKAAIKRLQSHGHAKAAELAQQELQQAEQKL